MAHGITGRLVTAGTSHGGLALSGCGEEAFLAESSIAEAVAHTGRAEERFASGKGSATCRMKLTPWGNAVDVRKHDTKSRLTARRLREVEYILVSRPDSQHTTDRSGRPPPDGRQPEAARGTVKPLSGTKGRDEDRGAKPPQTFLESFSVEARVMEIGPAGSHLPKSREITLLNLEYLPRGAPSSNRGGFLVQVQRKAEPIGCWANCSDASLPAEIAWRDPASRASSHM